MISTVFLFIVTYLLLWCFCVLFCCNFVTIYMLLWTHKRWLSWNKRGGCTTSNKKVLYLSLEFALQHPGIPVFRYLSQTLTGVFPIIPKSIIPRMGGPDHVAKPGQPSIGRKVLWMSISRPKSFEGNFVFGFITSAASAQDSWLRIVCFGDFFAEDATQVSIVHVPQISLF